MFNRLSASLVLLLALLTSTTMAAPNEPADQSAKPNIKTAIFAGGCFWCLEPPFDRAAGVLATDPGYSGGTTPNPTYATLKGSGHREVMRVTYDANIISYEQLLKIFWRNIDPLDAGGQMYDRGEAYKTAIFVADAAERKAAEDSKAKVTKALGQPVATEILPAKPFYLAEAEHQDYYRKNPLHYNAYKLGSGRAAKTKAIWEDTPFANPEGAVQEK